MRGMCARQHTALQRSQSEAAACAAARGCSPSCRPAQVAVTTPSCGHHRLQSCPGIAGCLLQLLLPAPRHAACGGWCNPCHHAHVAAVAAGPQQWSQQLQLQLLLLLPPHLAACGAPGAQHVLQLQQPVAPLLLCLPKPPACHAFQSPEAAAHLAHARACAAQRRALGAAALPPPQLPPPQRQRQPSVQLLLWLAPGSLQSGHGSLSPAELHLLLAPGALSL